MRLETEAQLRRTGTKQSRYLQQLGSIYRTPARMYESPCADKTKAVSEQAGPRGVWIDALTPWAGRAIDWLVRQALSGNPLATPDTFALPWTERFKAMKIFPFLPALLQSVASLALQRNRSSVSVTGRPSCCCAVCIAIRSPAWLDQELCVDERGEVLDVPGERVHVGFAGKSGDEPQYP